MNYGYGDDTHKMLGVWSVSILAPVVAGMGISDFVSYTSIKDDGRVWGRRAFNSNTLTLAEHIGDGQYLSITSVNESEYMMAIYRFRGLNRIVGLTLIFNNSKDGGDAVSDILDHGLLFLGNRNANSSDVSTKSAHQEKDDSAELDAIYAEMKRSMDIGAINKALDAVKF
ncbi:hypothetical protein [Nitrosococcus oceani]|uniref:Uncharacterized protein n=2 Tax=Nitrosococcus oceani TaxID=1229 RepID=Q3J9I7_NITOC|nr:hypothetical protein [Nitrosococcus oceani]ABA58509.1 hypothetical protein Noc_2049 [Nitrosococcus oceani ATCC 19707]EDZ67427.1 hypothetical protein NOC27_754 [Nitrosococcus oceani AFC27]KFI19113.1 hypothetical protein IB75_10925 [Nitrosococcus oceani C-27]KFI22280.1 hypothetical protein HW44_10410 [Nitrosococcus oceani]